MGREKSGDLDPLTEMERGSRCWLGNRKTLTTCSTKAGIHWMQRVQRGKELYPIFPLSDPCSGYRFVAGAWPAGRGSWRRKVE